MGDPSDLVEWRVPLLVQAVNAASIGDLLSRGALTADEIAQHTGWRPDLATRVLRVLAGRGLFHLDEDGQWSLTEQGQVLRSDHPDSVAGARLTGFEVGGWMRMLETLRTGEPSFRLAFGTGFWDWLDTHPADRAAFDEKMRGRLQLAREMVASYPWPEEGHLVDVGGGTGTLLTDVLRLRPAMTGTLLDLPAPLATARRVVDDSGAADRCDLVAGSFFDQIPAGGDLYLLSQIAHDWPDDDAVHILAGVRRAMAPTARLLLLEGVVGEDLGALALLDLHMLAMFGAGERAPQQWESLLERAGLRLDRIRPGAYLSWIEATPAEGRASAAPPV